jgi:hypothetical protein
MMAAHSAFFDPPNTVGIPSMQSGRSVKGQRLTIIIVMAIILVRDGSLLADMLDGRIWLAAWSVWLSCRRLMGLRPHVRYSTSDSRRQWPAGATRIFWR